VQKNGFSVAQLSQAQAHTRSTWSARICPKNGVLCSLTIYQEGFMLVLMKESWQAIAKVLIMLLAFAALALAVWLQQEG
jgi:hypothetical protein